MKFKLENLLCTVGSLQRIWLRRKSIFSFLQQKLSHLNNSVYSFSKFSLLYVTQRQRQFHFWWKFLELSQWLWKTYSGVFIVYTFMECLSERICVIVYLCISVVFIFTECLLSERILKQPSGLLTPPRRQS